MSSGKKTTVEAAAELAAELIAQMGLILWDVTFAKEGSVWVLCYLVDKEGGININDCEEFSRSMDKLLDDADFIDQSYTLEVSSPGVERELTQERHYTECMGKVVNVRLIRPVEGVRDFTGELVGYSDGVITIALDEETEMELKRSEAAFVRLHYEF